MKNLHHKKVTVSKHLQNTCLCCNIFENASQYTKLQHGQHKVCEIQFEILLLSLLLRKTSSSSAKPPTNPSAWSVEHCSSQRKHHLSWSDEHCSSCCTLSLIHLYLDNIGSKCNRAALCLFMKEMALLWCGRLLLEIISSFFSLLSNFVFSFWSP